MKIYQSTFLLYLLLLGIVVMPQSICAKESMSEHPTFREFTLKDLIRYALVHSAMSKNATYRLRINHFKVKNAVSQFFPSLDLKTDLGYRKDSMMLQDTPLTTGLTLSLSETLYNNGVNVTAYHIAKQENSRSFVEYARDQSQICLDVFREYSNYSLLTYLLKVQKAQYDLITQQFQLTEDEYKRGGKKRIDFLRLKAEFQRNQLSISQAETNINQSIENLKSIIGFRGKALKVAPMKVREIKYKPIDVKEIKNILESHYESKIASYSKNINKAQVQLERRRYWPSITVDANMSYLNSNHEFYRSDPVNLSAFITLRYNLWDWGIRKRNISIAEVTSHIQNNNIDQNLLRLRTQIETLFINIKQQINNLNLSKELIDLEKEAYDSIAHDYHNGLLTFLDFINAFNNYQRAQESHYTNFFNLKRLLSEYDHHRGDLYENIISY